MNDIKKQVTKQTIKLSLHSTKDVNKQLTKQEESMKVIVTPYKPVFERFLVDNDLEKRDVIHIKNHDDFNRVRGCHFFRDDIIYLDNWYLIDDVKDYLNNMAVRSVA